MNFLLHSLHWNLFSPVCVLLCRCNSSDLVNLFPQNNQVHTNGRSPVCHLRCALRWLVFPYTLLHPGMWQMCCFFLSVCRSPSLQFGQVHATLRTRCFCNPSPFCSLLGVVLLGSGGEVVTTTPGVMGALVAGWAVAVTLGITCHLLGSLGSCWMCWPTAICGAACWVITWTLPRPSEVLWVRKLQERCKGTSVNLKE